MTLSQAIPSSDYQTTWIGRNFLERKDPSSPGSIKELIKAIFQLSFETLNIPEFGFTTEDIVSTSINTSTIESALKLLHEYFNIRFPLCDVTIEYILQHQNIYDIIIYACIATEECFRERAQVSLELYRDPEIKDEYLTIYVRQITYEPNLIDEIDKLSEKFEEVLREVKELVSNYH